MTLMILTFSVLGIFFLMLSKDYDVEVPMGFCFVLVIISFIGFTTCYYNSRLIVDKIELTQEEISESLTKEVGDVERAKIRERVNKINKKLIEYKIDNTVWIWDLQVSDSVDNVKPIIM